MTACLHSSYEQQNYITESQRILEDNGGFTQLLMNDTEIDDIHNGTQVSQQENIELSFDSRCKPVYDVIKGLPKDLFLSNLIESTKDDPQLLDQTRSELFEVARQLPNFPEGVLVKRQKSRKVEKLAHDCYLIHMFINGDQSDDILAVISGGGRSVPATPVLSPKLPPDVITNIATLNASVHALDEFTEKTDHRLTEGIRHLLNLITAKDKWVEEIENVVNSLSSTVQDLSTKVIDQSNKIKSMESDIEILKDKINVSESKYESAMSEVATLNKALRAQGDLYDKLSHEEDGVQNFIKGEIKVIRRSVKSLEDEISTCNRSVNSCMTSVTFLRNQNKEVTKKLSTDYDKKYSDAVRTQKARSGSGCQSLGSAIITGQYCEAEESPDFSEHESSDENMELKSVVQREFTKKKRPSHNSHSLLKNREASLQCLRPTNLGMKSPSPTLRTDGIQEKELKGVPIRVVTNRTFHNQSHRTFYVGNIISDVSVEQVSQYLSRRNIKLIKIRMLPSKVQGKIGAQITIKDSDSRKILASSFWPTEVYARR